VRTFTGVYSTDVVPDSLITVALNIAVDEVARAQAWPASLTFNSAMVNNADTPGEGWERFHHLLIYRVATQVLQYEADDSNRSEWFTGEYNKALQEMAAYYLPAGATGESSNTTKLVRYVRDLTGQYGIELSDSLILAWLNEAYQELWRSNNWAESTATPAWNQNQQLNASTPPAFLGTLHPMLAYRVAAKVLAPLEGQDKKAAMYTTEAEGMYRDLVEYYFPSKAQGSPVIVEQIIQYVRDLTGVYDDTYSKTLISSWVNEAYVELASARDWQWLELTSLTETTEGQTQLQLPSGARRVLEVSVLSADRDAEEMIPTTQVLTLTDSEPYYHYDVTTFGLVTWQPPLREAGELHVRYLRDDVSFQSNGDSPLFAIRYRPILAYRVAAKIATLMGDKAKSEVFTREYNSLFDQMVSEYTLSHDVRPIQLGSNGLETRKYLPWFRTA
jgi:hypothetical protein